MSTSNRAKFNAHARQVLKANGFSKTHREGYVNDLKRYSIEQADARLVELIKDPKVQKRGKYKRQKPKDN